MKIVVVSGGFDPIHSGHIAYLEEAKKLGDTLIVALNSDDWLIKKKGKFFNSLFRWISRKGAKLYGRFFLGGFRER